jgi:hypothetical protein
MAVRSSGILGMRRFNDLVGLGWQGYPVLLALAVLAWHESRGFRWHVASIIRDVLVGSDWFKSKLARDVVYAFVVWGYIRFGCQSPAWRHYGWRRCPRDWRVTEKGYARLRELLENIGLTLDDVLRQPSPLDVKNLVDSVIRAVYREHWERVRRYEEVVGGVQ